MGRKAKLKRARRAARAAGPERDEECVRCGWIHRKVDPCFDEGCCGTEPVAAASFGLCASDGVHEVHEAHGGADAGPLAPAPGPFDPLHLTREILRVGPDALLPNGTRAGEVFPELFEWSTT